jgi:hypothetical protein
METLNAKIRNQLGPAKNLVSLLENNVKHIDDYKYNQPNYEDILVCSKDVWNMILKEREILKQYIEEIIDLTKDL